MRRCSFIVSMFCFAAQRHDIRLFSSEEDSSLYFTYSGGENKLEVKNLHYEVKMNVSKLLLELMPLTYYKLIAYLTYHIKLFYVLMETHKWCTHYYNTPCATLPLMWAVYMENHGVSFLSGILVYHLPI